MNKKRMIKLLKNNFFIKIGEHLDLLSYYIEDDMGNLKGHESLEKAKNISRSLIKKGYNYLEIIDSNFNLVYIFDVNKTEAECDLLVKKRKLKDQIKKID